MFGDPTFFLISLPIILMTVAVHEFSHAKVADTLGDPTPRLSGRLSLNPLSHIDPIGLLMLIIVRFGWAKPVPVNQYNFANPRLGMALVGIAGPISNMFMAWICAILVRNVPLGGDTVSAFTAKALVYAVWINVGLGLFNLIPIPPLDGSRVLRALVPAEFTDTLDAIEPYGFFILIAILFFPSTQDLLVTAINAVVRIFL